MSVTPLVFYRRYHTYQALLGVHPQGDAKEDTCFRKAVLYVMQWIGSRIRQTVSEDISEADDNGGAAATADVSFLNDYPEPDDYRLFDIRQVRDIYGLEFADLRTAYVEEQENWVLRLTEPDNGRDEKNQGGRTFITSIFVCRKESSAVLGVRITCKEPYDNELDAAVFRPAFIRQMSRDPGLILTEAGVPVSCAFSGKPVRVNGKSGQNCQQVFDELIGNAARQMPVAFIPGSCYDEDESLRSRIDGLSKSMLGFCHVVLWDRTPYKLFHQQMKDEELVKAAEDGKVIFYRNNPASDADYPTSFLIVDPPKEDEGAEPAEGDAGDAITTGVASDVIAAERSAAGDAELKLCDWIDELKRMGYQEPLRKSCCFDGYSFDAPWWNVSGMKKASGDQEISVTAKERIKLLEERLGKMEVNIRQKERDNDYLQRQIDDLGRKNDRMNKKINKLSSDKERIELALQDAGRETREALEKLREARERAEELKKENRSNAKSLRKRLEPLMDLPKLTINDKEDMLEWIRSYYKDLLIIHPDAEKAFYKDNVNRDWKQFCRMIHFLSGWTLQKNQGDLYAEEIDASFDPFHCGFTAVFISRQSGAVKQHREKYTVDISDYDPQKGKVLIDQHTMLLSRSP